MKYSFVILILTLIFLTSCNSGVVYEHEELIDGKWDFDKELVYEIPVKDTLTKYDLVATVTHSSEFTYQNFYVDLSTKFPDGRVLNDAVSFQLTDGVGSWEGRCSGSQCKVNLLLQNKFRFQQIGDYRLGIKNNSRVELDGVKKVELRLIELKEEK